MDTPRRGSWSTCGPRSARRRARGPPAPKEPRLGELRKNNPGPLRACVLLAGGIRPSPLVVQTRLSELDLSLRPGATVLSTWLDRFGALIPSEVRPEIRILHGSTTPGPEDTELRRRGVPYRVVAE